MVPILDIPIDLPAKTPQRSPVTGAPVPSSQSGLDEAKVRQHFCYVFPASLRHVHNAVHTVVNWGQWSKGWPHHKPRRLTREERGLVRKILNVSETIAVSTRNPPCDAVRVALAFLGKDYQEFQDVVAALRAERRYSLWLDPRLAEAFAAQVTHQFLRKVPR